MEIAVIAGWLFLSICIGYAANQRGRSGCLASIVALLLSPIAGLIYLLCIGEDKTVAVRKQLKDGAIKKCPQCAEFVQSEAKICRFCQHKFGPDNYDRILQGKEEQKPRQEGDSVFLSCKHCNQRVPAFVSACPYCEKTLSKDG